MPGSVKHGKNEIQKFIESLNDIRHIVDVGAGSGTYPKLLGRDYIYTGIEIFIGYVGKFDLHFYYSRIIIDDIYDMVFKKRLPDGDCIIFGDVLEHLPKDKALTVLDEALKKYKHVVISIPIDGREGAIHYGNEHERHLSDWTFEELKSRADWKFSHEVKGIGVFCI